MSTLTHIKSSAWRGRGGLLGHGTDRCAGYRGRQAGAAVVAVWRALVNGDGQFHGFCASLGTAAERDRLVTLEPTHRCKGC